MDAFSLSLAYGTNKITTKNIILLSIFVGIFHFIMPYIGSMIGNSILSYLTVSTNIFVAVVLLILSLEMYCSRNEEKAGSINNFLSIIIFSFTVSIDSFTVGIALGLTEKNILLAGLIFSIVSSIFTYTGLVLGQKIYQKLGKKAMNIGIIILIIVALTYLF